MILRVIKVGKGERGFTFVETVISLAVLGLIAVTLLSGLAGGTRSSAIMDERNTARNLAESQLEWAKNQPYASTYTLPAPPAEYANYSAAIAVTAIPGKDSNIQKITITVSHQAKQVLVLEDYRSNR